MPLIDARGAALRAFDRAAAAFARRCAIDHEASTAETAHDRDRLCDLARRLAADLAHWSRAVDDLGPARRATLSRERAGPLLIESVFDETLTPDACEILAAAMALTETDA